MYNYKIWGVGFRDHRVFAAVAQLRSGGLGSVLLRKHSVYYKV